ncbi:MAG: hypothetical protein ABR600_12660 [Actinomycetota bacterium]|nr:hypothetical protein [Actinomycetota bacterium]
MPSEHAVPQDPAQPSTVELLPPVTVPLTAADREHVVRLLAVLLRERSTPRAHGTRTAWERTPAALPIGPAPNGNGWPDKQGGQTP